MASRSQIQVAITVAVVVWAGMLAAQGVTLKASYLRPYSVAVGAAVLALFGYERWFWHWPVLRRVTNRPDLRGTWSGLLRSSWVNPETGEPVAPIPVHLAITQSFSTVALRLMTPESSSESMACSIVPAHNGSPTIVWSTYVNTPDMLIQGRSRTHQGAMRLEVHGAPDRLSGAYWTDRFTAGEVVFDRRITRLHTSFVDATTDQRLSVNVPV